MALSDYFEKITNSPKLTAGCLFALAISPKVIMLVTGSRGLSVIPIVAAVLAVCYYGYSAHSKDSEKPSPRAEP